MSEMINLPIYAILAGLTRTLVVWLMLPKGKNKERSKSGNYTGKTEVRQTHPISSLLPGIK